MRPACKPDYGEIAIRYRTTLERCRRTTRAGTWTPAARRAVTFLALILGLTAAAGGAVTPVDEMTVLEVRPGAGERCIVCRSDVHGDPVVEMRYKGRVFHVRHDMEDLFRQDPEAYFRDLQARGGLFDEMSISQGGQAAGGSGTSTGGHPGWLYFGLYVLVGLLFGAACSALAVARAIPALPWFFWGLLANVVALAILLRIERGDASRLPAGIPVGLGKVPLTRAPAACSSCGSDNHPAARACSSCGATLLPAIEAETVRV